MLPPIQRDPWDVSHFQLPVPVRGTCSEYKVPSRVWLRYRVSPSVRNYHISLGLSADVVFSKAVKKKLVKYCGPGYSYFVGLFVLGFYFPASEMGRPFMCSKAESK